MTYVFLQDESGQVIATEGGEGIELESSDGVGRSSQAVARVADSQQDTVAIHGSDPQEVGTPA